jgi:hypothetical protein
LGYRQKIGTITPLPVSAPHVCTEGWAVSPALPPNAYERIWPFMVLFESP